MAFKKTVAFMLIMVLSIGLVGCGTSTDTTSNNSSSNQALASNETSEELQQINKVLEDYFHYMNEKDEEKILTTMTPHWVESKINWDFENLESISIDTINEETQEFYLDEYFLTGRGKTSGIAKENVKVMRVKYKVDYKVNKNGYNDGYFDRWFYVIKEGENSSWLIDDFTM